MLFVLLKVLLQGGNGWYWFSSYNVVDMWIGNKMILSAKKKKSGISALKFLFHTEKFPTFPISILCLID